MAHRAARRHRNNGAMLSPAAAAVQEMIGRSAPPYLQSSLYRSRTVTTSVDATVPDYIFYDQLRRCKLAGYKLSGLFCRRIEQVLASWVFGEGVTVTLNKDIAEQYDEAKVEYTNEQIKNFIDGLLDSGQDSESDDPDRDDQNGAILLTLYRDALGLGDQYAVVNVDGSLSIPSPDTVEVKRDPLDYRKVLAVVITTRLEKATIIDEYRADGRTVTTKVGGADGKTTEVVEEYPNLIARIPITHIAYARSGNETNGHSIHEELLPLYDQYDDVLEKMLDGAKILGNPFLAFTGLENLAAVIDLNQPATPETYYDAGGALVERPAMNIDRNSVFAIGKGGDAKFVAPPVGFTKDTETTLNMLFWILFEHLGIPESVWGGELSSARATSETQLTQFVKELRGWQADNGGWVVKLCKIWLQFKALTDPQIVVNKLSVEWPAAVGEDKELLLKFIDLARRYNLLTDEETLRLTELVEDAKAEVEKARGEAEKRMAQEDERMAAQAAVQAEATGKSQATQEMIGYTEGEIAGAVTGAIRHLVGEQYADAL